MLTNEELVLIKGGGVTAAFVTALIKVYDTIYEIGRAVGSAIRHITSNNYCKVR